MLQFNTKLDTEKNEVMKMEENTELTDLVNIENFKYGIVVTNKGCNIVYHIAMYENKPTEQEIEHLKIELETDEEFGLLDKTSDKEFAIIGEEDLKRLLKEIDSQGTEDVNTRIDF
jgi:hypothetical protein